jgi:hypothetical protein
MRNLTNQVFGKLTALENIGSDKNTRRVWRCRCACGRFIEVTSNALLKANTQSCGCSRKGKFKTHCSRGHLRIPENVGNHGECKLCNRILGDRWKADNLEKHVEVTARADKKWRTKNPDYFKYEWVKRKYGMSRQEYDARIAQQQNRCMICKKIMERPNVDHDHETNQVRDLLCWNCNGGLGQFMDDPVVAQAAVDYLKRWKKV